MATQIQWHILNLACIVQMDTCKPDAIMVPSDDSAHNSDRYESISGDDQGVAFRGMKNTDYSTLQYTIV